MGPFMLAILVAWFLVYRFGQDTRTAVRRLAARGADTVSRTAERVASSGGTVDQDDRGVRGAARWVRDRSVAVAEAIVDRLRSRPSPTTPRTAAGQRETAKTKPVAANSWLGMITNWLRVTWADAVAAAESSQERRKNDTYDQPRRWWDWPTGDDPQAPVQATAERLDKKHADDKSADTDIVHEIPGQDPGCTELFQNAFGEAAFAQDDVIDAEIVEDASTPLLSATPVAALPAGKSGGQMSENTVDNTAAESGLGSYLAYSQKMANNCAEAVNSAEATLNALQSQGWSGAPVEAIQTAREQLESALGQFDAAHAAFQAALSVREAYAANNHAGTKESVMSD